MDIYKQKNVNDKIVVIIGWNNRDVVLGIYGTDNRFAMNWNIFLEHYERIEPFDCDVSEYEGPNLTVE